MARFRALTQFQFDHLDLITGRGFGKPLGAEGTVAVAASEVAGANFPDDVAAHFAMIGTETSFTGTVGESAKLGTAIERAHGIGTECSEAHRRNVEDRCRIRLAAIGAPDGD